MSPWSTLRCNELTSCYGFLQPCKSTRHQYPFSFIYKCSSPGHFFKEGVGLGRWILRAGRGRFQLCGWVENQTSAIDSELYSSSATLLQAPPHHLYSTPVTTLNVSIFASEFGDICYAVSRCTVAAASPP